MFEDCQEEPPPGCGWVEQPEDELDWIIAAGIVILIFQKKMLQLFFIAHSRPENLKKVQAKKLVKSNISISQKEKILLIFSMKMK